MNLCIQFDHSDPVGLLTFNFEVVFSTKTKNKKDEQKTTTTKPI